MSLVLLRGAAVMAAEPENTTAAVLVARKGRLRQRYDNEYRLVAGVVPYRVGADGHTEVLMVSTPNRDDLVFPKVCNNTASIATAALC